MYQEEELEVRLRTFTKNRDLKEIKQKKYLRLTLTKSYALLTIADEGCLVFLCLVFTTDKLRLRTPTSRSRSSAILRNSWPTLSRSSLESSQEVVEEPNRVFRIGSSLIIRCLKSPARINGIHIK